MGSRGVGAYLLRWSQTQAAALFADVSAGQRIMEIHTESLTEPAHHLYHAFGFEKVFESTIMRRDLRQSLPDNTLPPGVTIANWRPELAERFFQAYHNAFRERPGFPGWSPAEWIANVTENDHRSDWSFLASVEDVPVGFVIGNMDTTTNPPAGFIWQVGVVPAYRRRGLGSALMIETMRRMQAEGAPSVQLTVNINNPGAREAYARLDFMTAGSRARYERIAE